MLQHKNELVQFSFIAVQLQLVMLQNMQVRFKTVLAIC